ncbi:MAG: DUF4349 domain-containing protein [Spirochaetota bacterium]
MYKPINKVLLVFSLSCIVAMMSCATPSKQGGSALYEDTKDSAPGYERSASRMKKMPGRTEGEMPQDSSAPAEKEDTPGQRMIIYNAELDLEVDRIKDTLKVIERETKKYEGFIESVVTSDTYKKATVVVRVPVADFEKAVNELAKTGTVTGRKVSASDITMEFQDITLRLQTNKKIRERLYLLLKNTKDPKKKVKILREIEKLDKKIEILRATIEYLRSKAEFSTITMYLTARVREVVHQYLPSPFPWVARITADKRTIFNDSVSVEYKKPDGFFDFSKNFFDVDEEYLFKTPRGECGIRLGSVENYPPADTGFWYEAILYEFENRYYKNIKTEKDSKINEFYRIDVELKDGTWYSLFLRVIDDTILIVEVKALSNEVFEKHKKEILGFVESINDE